MKEIFEIIDDWVGTFWVEVFPVLRGLRSTGIVEIPDENVSRFKSYLEENDVAYQLITVSELNEERIKRGKDLFLDQQHENIFYIGDEARKVRMLVEGDRDNDFFCVGMMLGYPDCCVATLFKTGTESLDIKALKSNFSMIAHIPCSSTCPRTIEYDSKLKADKERYLEKIANGRNCL
ncbi:MAG TPA: hypothetical protein PKH33_08235 [bacterium]|nr:hypothetical protein [bacterium]